MPNTSRLAWALLIGSTVTPSFAFAQGDPFDTTLRSVHFQGENIRVVVAQLFSHVKAKYVLDPEVRGTITLDLSGVEFEVALRRALKQVGATLIIDSGVWRLSPVLATRRYELKEMVEEIGDAYGILDNAIRATGKPNFVLSKDFRFPSDVRPNVVPGMRGQSDLTRLVSVTRAYPKRRIQNGNTAEVGRSDLKVEVIVILTSPTSKKAAPLRFVDTWQTDNTGWVLIGRKTARP